MTLRNAGVLRKLPYDDNLFLTVDGESLWVRGDGIPAMLSGIHKPVYNRQHDRVGIIKRWSRVGFEDLIDITFNNLTYNVRLSKFLNVWNCRSPCCSICERIPDIWQGFTEVTA